MIHGHLKLSTQVTITVLLVDSADHVTGKTGLSAGLTITASKSGTYSSTPITPTVTELDATNAKGLYSLILTTTHTNTLGELLLHITASGADPADYWFQVSTYIPGEAATLQADQAVNTTKFGGTTVTGRDLGASVLLSSGSGTGQLDFTSGVVKSNLAQILGTALTETAGQIAAAFKKLFDVSSPVLTATSVNQTGDNYARIGAPAGASVSADIAAVKTDTGNLVTRITSGLFTGITSLAEWLGLIAGKQTGNTTARTEVRATGAGSGTFDETTDSQEALRDRGDAAWTTVSAGSIRSAVGLASANLDTQLDALPTAAEIRAEVDSNSTQLSAIKAKTDNLPSDPADASDVASSFSSVMSALSTIAGYIDTEVAAIKSKTDNLPSSPAATGDAMTLTAAYDAAKTASQAGDAMALTSGERNSVADALLDRSDAIETGLTVRGALRLDSASLAGKLSGAAGTTVTIRNAVADSKDRLVATVDANGNRTAITTDVS